MLVSLWLMVACTSEKVHQPSAEAPKSGGEGQGSPSIPTEIPQANGQPKILELGKGKNSAEYRIEALDPATHIFSVGIATTPKADLKVWVTTHYGVTLRVVDSTLKDPSCQRSMKRLACRLAFPVLEAQRAGAWTVHVLKMTGEAATVVITFSFAPAGGGAE